MTDATIPSPSGGAQTAERDLKNDAQDVAKAVDKKVSEAAGQGAKLKDSAAEMANSLGQKAQETADQVRRTVTEQSEVAREWAADQADVLRDTVQTKPFIAVGVSAASAFAAGLILGVLLTRR